MAIISQKTFDKFTEEEKSEFRKIYNEILKDYQNAKKQGYVEKSDEIYDRLIQLEIFFGKENLQPKTPKTWKDVTKINPNYEQDCQNIRMYTNMIDNRLKNKLLATYRISKLIELGYGGVITDEEWNDKDIIKFSIVRFQKNLAYKEVRCAYEFISFHTPEQREEFMSHPENKKIIEQYYITCSSTTPN